MAIIALIIPPPKTPATAMANTKLGNAKNTSTILITILSNNPPIYPLIIPIKLPNTNISETKISDEKIVLDAPYIILENTHLPKASVPKKNSLLGAFNVFCKSILYGSLGAIYGANKLIPKIITINIKIIKNLFFLLSFVLIFIPSLCFNSWVNKLI